MSGKCVLIILSSAAMSGFSETIVMPMYWRTGTPNQPFFSATQPDSHTSVTQLRATYHVTSAHNCHKAKAPVLLATWFEPKYWKEESTEGENGENQDKDREMISKTDQTEQWRLVRDGQQWRTLIIIIIVRQFLTRRNTRRRRYKGARQPYGLPSCHVGTWSDHWPSAIKIKRSNFTSYPVSIILDIRQFASDNHLHSPFFTKDAAISSKKKTADKRITEIIQRDTRQSTHVFKNLFIFVYF